MLVLSRKRYESILIGEGIRVTIIAIGNHRVKIGIDAPPEVSVLRHELVVRDSANDPGTANGKTATHAGNMPPAAPTPSPPPTQLALVSPGE